MPSQVEGRVMPRQRGTLGTGNTTQDNIPPPGEKVLGVAATFFVGTECVHTMSDQIVCWYQSPARSSFHTIMTNSGSPLAGAVAGGAYCAILGDGSLWCWAVNGTNNQN